MSSTMYDAAEKPRRDSRFPPVPLFAAGAMIGLSLLAAGVGRLTGAATPQVLSTPVAVRELRFADRADGGIDVTDATTGLHVQTVTGQAGFLRGTVRGLASQRKREGKDGTVPFRLTAWRDGRLTLDDPAVRRHVELAAFGPDNEAVFARLLVAPEGKS